MCLATFLCLTSFILVFPCFQATLRCDVIRPCKNICGDATCASQDPSTTKKSRLKAVTKIRMAFCERNYWLSINTLLSLSTLRAASRLGRSSTHTCTPTVLWGRFRFCVIESSCWWMSSSYGYNLCNGCLDIVDFPLGVADSTTAPWTSPSLSLITRSTWPSFQSPLCRTALWTIVSHANCGTLGMFHFKSVGIL